MRAGFLAALLLCGCGGGDPCGDGISDGDESDVDCGGSSCGKCQAGQLCFVNADCAAGFCANGHCPLPTCVDGKKNGKESDVDCGGGACPGCNGGQGCLVAVDCASFTCVNNVCAADAQCLDQMQDGDESDVDCGGGVCPGCADGMRCAMPQDCAGGACTSGVCGAGDPCSDGSRDGDESDVDCGGSCPRCGDGKMCGAGPDCQSGVCLGGSCATPQALTLGLAPPVSYQIGVQATPVLIAAGDVDGDKKLDLIVASQGQQMGVVTIFPGDGLGGFGVPKSANVDGQPAALVVGDWNGDGRSDVAIGTGTGVGVLLGAANGQLVAQSPLVATEAAVVVAGELTGDQHLDLFVVEMPGDRSQRAIGHLWVGKGTGAFQKGAAAQVGLQPVGGAVGDFNRDGKRDVLVSNLGDQNNANASLSVLLNAGGGAFKPSVETAANVPFYPSVGDWNGDGKSDVYYLSQGTLISRLGVGDGNFMPPAMLADANFPAIPLSADLDLDGNIDLVAFDSENGNSLLSVFRGNGDGTFKPEVTFPSVLGPQAAAVGDWNGDGKPDLAVIAANTMIAVLRNTSQ